MQTAIETAATGFALCDSSALRAVSRRHIGSLPYCLALACCDIGEAVLEDGRRVIITWGRNITPREQFAFAHQTTFSPVWIGADNGACELVLGETFGSRPQEEWLWTGLRLQSNEIVWESVDDSGLVKGSR